MMLILAYISAVAFDQVGKGGFTVSFGTSNAAYSSSLTFYVDLAGTEGEIEEAIRMKVVEAVNLALGTSLTSEDVRLF
jgi:hypothetical protein